MIRDIILLISLFLSVNSVKEYDLKEIEAGAELFVNDNVVKFETDAQAMRPLDDYYSILFDRIIDVQRINKKLLENVITIAYTDQNMIKNVEAYKFIGTAPVSLIGLESGINWIEVRKNFVKYDDQKQILNSIQTALFEAKTSLDSLNKIISAAKNKPTIESIENRDQEVVLNIKDSMQDMYNKVDNTKEIEVTINQTKKAIDLINKLFADQETKRVYANELPLYFKKN